MQMSINRRKGFSLVCLVLKFPFCDKTYALYFKQLVVKVDAEFVQNNTIKIEGILYFGYTTLKYYKQ